GRACLLLGGAAPLGVFFPSPKTPPPPPGGPFLPPPPPAPKKTKTPPPARPPAPPVGPRRVGTCHDQGGALIIIKTILVGAVTRRSAVQKVTGAFGQNSAFL